METFLGKLSEEIQSQGPLTEGGVCVVFPSRRATIFFQDEFARKMKAPGPIPDSLSFEDFLQEITGKIFPDTLTLAFELYPFYNEKFPGESFDRFYSWAGTLLSGFEESEQALAGVKNVFRAIHQLRELDDSITLWSHEGEEESEYRKRFQRLWESVPGLYEKLSAWLRMLGMASPGMVLREVIESGGLSGLKIRWKKIWFAGFGSLTIAEEKFMQLLIEQGIAEARWDLDAYYLENKEQEAGKYFRQLQNRTKGLQWIENFLNTETKTITITGVAGRAGQAKAAGMKIEAIASENIGKNTAVILPDEGMLFPLLHALPPTVREVNVTMGFPLKGTPLFAISDSILQVHEGADAIHKNRNKYLYYHRDINTLLRHPYLRAICPDASAALYQHIRNDNVVYLDYDEIRTFLEVHPDSGMLLKIFRPPGGPDEVAGLFLDLMNDLRAVLETRAETSGYRNDTELELLFHFRALILRLRDRLADHLSEISLKTFRRLFRELIRQASVPFTGEPLSGLQVMGVLESRVLSFDNLIILSVNEGIFPSGSNVDSFIPHTVRKAFGLPTFEERDSLFAFHFYRLIQRASNVTLIYNTEPDVLGGGERSRFIEQVTRELAAKNPNIRFAEEQLVFGAIAPQMPELELIKTPEVLEKIRKHGTEKGFSPSALNSYLSCSMQFYLRFVKGLREKEEVEESAEADTFGQIFHKVMERLYQPFLQRNILKSDFPQLKKNIPSITREAFMEIAQTRNLGHGKNHLLLGVLEELALKSLEADEDDAPFILHALEQPISMTVPIPGGEVKLRGIIDRVDEVQGQKRIIDYKTGKIGSLKLEDPGHAGEEGNHKEAFQLATYALLFLHTQNSNESVKPGIISLRTLSKGVQPLEYGITRAEILDRDALSAFNNRLREIITEILDPGKPFSKTEDERVCEFCAYKEICNRQ